jgi:hypothetical protein
MAIDGVDPGGLPVDLPYSTDQILDDDWLPEPAGAGPGRS